MHIIKPVKQLEIIILSVTWIENNNLVLISLVIRLVISQEHISPQIRVHFSHAIQEYVRPLIAVRLVNMIHYKIVDIKPESLTISFASQRPVHSIRINLLLLQKILKIRRMTQKPLTIKKSTKLLK